MILHALEDDYSISGRLDLVVKDLELISDAEVTDFRFDQALGALRQRLLHLADTDRKRAFFSQALLDQQLAEEMALA